MLLCQQNRRHSMFAFMWVFDRLKHTFKKRDTENCQIGVKGENVKLTVYLVRYWRIEKHSSAAGKEKHPEYIFLLPLNFNWLFPFFLSLSNTHRKFNPNIKTLRPQHNGTFFISISPLDLQSLRMTAHSAFRHTEMRIGNPFDRHRRNLTNTFPSSCNSIRMKSAQRLDEHSSIQLWTLIQNKV